MSLTTILLVLAFAAAGFYLYKTFGPQPKKKSTANGGVAEQHGVHFSDSDSDSSSGSDSEDEDEEKEFTLEELAKYNGRENQKIYISVMGNVFDVTHSNFYGPNDAYNMFAGKDATINLTKSSFDESTLNKLNINSEPITVQNEMQGQLDFYSMKYKKVGWLREWFEVNGGGDDKSADDKKND